MCGKLGNNEIESMQNMMSMAVYSILADIFDVDIGEQRPEKRFRNDDIESGGRLNQLKIVCNSVNAMGL